jgi:hypothetical protein
LRGPAVSLFQPDDSNREDARGYLSDHRNGTTLKEYDQVRQKVGIGENPPPGARLHIAARGDDGKIRVIEVWDAREDAEAFGEKVMAARSELGSEASVRR